MTAESQDDIRFRFKLVPMVGLFVLGFGVPFLATLIGFGRFEMNWAGIIVAALFALAHASNFWTRA